jgi:hypothetical protein
MIVQSWEFEVLDDTAACLYGKMEEEIHMKCPK